MDVVLSLIGVVIGAALSMFADTRHERRADRVRRYEAAKSIGKDIAEVMNVLDAARVKVWEAQRHGGESVPDHVAVSAFAEFRDSLPRLLLAVRMARAEPLTPSAIEALQRFDSELGRLPERPDNFHMLGDERMKVNEAFDAFLDEVGKMAP
jgi:hypothetical protein